MFTFSQLPEIIGGDLLQLYKDTEIHTLVLDSRKALVAESSLFFSVVGDRHDGHQFINSLYKSGLRQFIIERNIDPSPFPEANFIRVDRVIDALQKLVTAHRKQFSFPVIGVTGSNGKTIVKEWLYQLLSPDQSIVKNPGSYNSQIGVPLSVWQMQPHHTLGIFEAGISKPGEMARLQSVIQPTIGIFTNEGSAHDEGFKDRRQKVEEKFLLFSSSALVIYCHDQPLVANLVGAQGRQTLSWGKSFNADVTLVPSKSGLQVSFAGKEFLIRLPFSDSASVENVSHCVTIMLHLGYSASIIQERISQLKTVPMRLQLKQGINQCQVIDDTYNNDLAGLQISLDFLAGIQGKKKTVILSDIFQSGLSDLTLAEQVASLLKKAGVTRFIAIGSQLQKHGSVGIPAFFYTSTDEFLKNYDWNDFQQEAILVKGARVFQFERIVQRLEKKIHGTVMEIDLGAMVHNLNLVKSGLKPGVKLMVMVKAFAYGSGSEEVAGLLQYHQIDYLGVAYADEGVALRKNKISLPIMVMNPSDESFQTLLDHGLEPEIYSVPLLRSFVNFLNGRKFAIHLKLDTGMHRLGIEKNDIVEAIDILKQNPNITVASVFSHLAGADEARHDTFTQTQFDRFENMRNALAYSLQINPLAHILNSSGIIRFPEYQLTMVRLGIALYGIDPTGGHNTALKPVATLKTVISQIKKINAGDSIGYGRMGQAHRDMKIATIAIGYADGFSRMFSNGVGTVLINGKSCAVVGNVCMDMTMVDITDIDARVDDEVTIFGGDKSIDEVAKSISTIPYEILTNTSERVKRIFYAESL